MTSFTIEELAAQSEVSVRTIRYYQSAGLLPAVLPDGRHVRYGPEHLDRLLWIRERLDQGVRIEAMRAELAHEHGEPGRRINTRVAQLETVTRVVVREGVELYCSPTRSGLSDAQVTRIADAISAQIGQFEKDDGLPSFRTPTPALSLELIDQLERRGMNDEAFAAVHPKPGETIRSHRQYLAGLKGRFHAGSPNELVNQRLQYIAQLLAIQHADNETVPESVMKESARKATEFLPRVIRS